LVRKTERQQEGKKAENCVHEPEPESLRQQKIQHQFKLSDSWLTYPVNMTREKFFVMIG